MFCTHRPRGCRGAEYVVKYHRPDVASAAALISEVVCHALQRLALDDHRVVIVEAMNLAAATAEKEADALAGRLAAIRTGESKREIRFVLGYLAPAMEQPGERALRAWLEHVSGAPLFDLVGEAEAFRAAAAASLAELPEPVDRDGAASATAARARPRSAAQRGRRKTVLP